MFISRKLIIILSIFVGFLFFLEVFFSQTNYSHFNFAKIASNSPENVSAQFDVRGCGQSKKCVFGACLRPNEVVTCHYLFSVYPDSEKPNEYVQMELFAKRDSPDVKYIAVGFSEDKLMGEDSVTYCVLNGNDGQIEAHLSMNPANDKSNVPGPPGSEDGILQLLNAIANDEGIYCKVRQRTNPSEKRDLLKPNLQKPYHLLFAKGNAAETRGVIDIHSLDPNKPDFPFVHPNPLLILDVNAATTINQPQQNGGGQNREGGGRLNLVDAHGILMIISWLGMTTVAIYSARYMRNAWPHTTVMGLKIWFHIHRTLNFLAVIFMVVSIILILLNKKSWTGPWFGRGKIGLNGWHSLAGAFSVFFALTQPFGALFRCGIDHPKRPIFNWLHRCTGLFAFIAAQISIFIAIYKFKIHFALADFALCLLIFFYAILAIIVLISEVLRLMERREQEKITSIEMQTRSRGSNPSNVYYYHSRKDFSSKLVNARKTIFTVAACICSGTALILMLLILFQ